MIFIYSCLVHVYFWYMQIHRGIAILINFIMQTCTACCMPYKRLYFPPILIVFNRHSHLYHTCTIYRGWEGWLPKIFKNSADLLAIHLPRWKRPKQEERMIDRMAILWMVAMPTKKHGTLVYPCNHLPLSDSLVYNAYYIQQCMACLQVL